MTKTKSKTKINEIVTISMFTAIICVLSVITLPLGPVPFSLGLFAVFITGALLTPKQALISVSIYLLLGGVGLPVFASFKSGFQTLFGLTGGYLMSYPIVVYIIAKTRDLLIRYTGSKYKFYYILPGMIIGTIICYLLGTIWFVFMSKNSFQYSLMICVVPFIPLDIIKMIFACFFSKIIQSLNLHIN
ncbi:MAG TPA: biotin transporter BioY [Clostridiales bacterium]|nr:biotin transporter BioY [Clostridiales bacterium]